MVKETVGGKVVTKTLQGSPRSVLVLGADGLGIQVVAGGKVQDVGDFKLDPDANPKKLIFTLATVGPKDSVAIYSLSGDDLILAFNAQNPSQPPADFSGTGPSDWVWHLKRVKN